MKVNEFVEYMKTNTNKTTREDQVLSMAKRQLDAKSYLSIKAKRDLVDEIIDACILYEDGIYKFDGIAKYVYFTMYTIAAYTNLELSDDVEADFDALSESQLLPVVLSMLQSEYDDVNILLQMQCDSVLEKNSVEAQLGKVTTNIIDFLNNSEAGLKSLLDKIPADKINLNKILEFVNKMGIGQGG